MTDPLVVTGLGLSTSIGSTCADVWRQVAGGEPAAARETREGGLAHATALAEAATQEALDQARLENESVAPERVACLVSASKPLVNGDGWAAPDAVGAALRGRFRMEGPFRNVIAACATGAYAVAIAGAWVQEGLCDVAVAGSVEPALHPLMEAGFRQMGVMTSEPVMRPFARDRQGFVPGFGAGVLVVEKESHARRRGAVPLVRLSGWGLGADAHSPVAFNSNGEKIAGVIRRAVSHAALTPSAIRHLNAHGTATRLNDWLETQALRSAFGPAAERLHISATKSSTGHLLGAAGSVEAVLTALALLHQFVPPTRHLTTVDPECALDYTPGEGHSAGLDHAVSVSFGFGGSIGALVLSRS